MSLIQTSKEIYDLLKKGATLDLQEKLMKIREEALELQEENTTLKLRIRELEERAAIKEKLEWDGYVYWLKNTDNSKDGPFCQLCHDVETKLVRLQDNDEIWRCMSCKNNYDKR